MVTLLDGQPYRRRRRTPKEDRAGQWDLDIMHIQPLCFPERQAKIIVESQGRIMKMAELSHCCPRRMKLATLFETIHKPLQQCSVVLMPCGSSKERSSSIRSEYFTMPCRQSHPGFSTYPGSLHPTNQCASWPCGVKCRISCG